MYEHNNDHSLDFLDHHEHDVPSTESKTSTRGVGVPLERDPLGFLTELLGGNRKKAQKLDDAFKAAKENSDSTIVKFCRKFGIE